jgi:methionyl-tRNA formyltransferase
LENNIEVLSPEKLDGEILEKIKDYDLFFVLAYGKLLKKELLDLPKLGV